VIKLRDKTREEGRIKRVYEKARTPYDRLLTSRQITKQAKQQLRLRYGQLNRRSYGASWKRCKRNWSRPATPKETCFTDRPRAVQRSG
jgi:hypothetical protein